MSETFDPALLQSQVDADPIDSLQQGLKNYIASFEITGNRLEALLVRLDDLRLGKEEQESELPDPEVYRDEWNKLSNQLARAVEDLSRVKLTAGGPGLWSCRKHGISWEDHRQGFFSPHGSDRVCVCGELLRTASDSDLQAAVLRPAQDAVEKLGELREQLRSEILQAGYDLPGSSS